MAGSLMVCPDGMMNDITSDDLEMCSEAGTGRLVVSVQAFLSCAFSYGSLLFAASSAVEAACIAFGVGSGQRDKI